MIYIISKNFPRYKDEYFRLLCGNTTKYLQVGEALGKRSEDFLSQKKAKFLSYWTLIFLIIFNFRKKFFIGSWDSVKALILCLIVKDLSLLIEGRVDIRHGLKGKIKRFIIMRSKLVICTNKQTLADIRFFLPSQHIEYIPSVGFPGNFIPLKKSNEMKFVYIGRLAPEKRIDLMVEFFNNFKQRCEPSKISLDIYGESESNFSLDMITASPDITLKGKINNTSLTTLLGNYDALFLFSSYEPWGLVVDEALKAGVLPVVSNHVGARELKDLKTGFSNMQVVSDIASFDYKFFYALLLKLKKNKKHTREFFNSYVEHEEYIKERLNKIGTSRFH